MPLYLYICCSCETGLFGPPDHSDWNRRRIFFPGYQVISMSSYFGCMFGRVVADGHCQWACETFTMLHSQYFASRPSLQR